MRMLRWVQGNLQEQVRTRLAEVSDTDDGKDDERGIVDTQAS